MSCCINEKMDIRYGLYKTEIQDYLPYILNFVKDTEPLCQALQIESPGIAISGTLSDL